jgi:hypothetical protein
LTWIALLVSGLALVAGVLATWRAHRAEQLADSLIRQAGAVLDRLARLEALSVAAAAGAPPLAGEPSGRQLIAMALHDGDSLSRACHAVIDAFDDGGEPPTAGDYARLSRCSDLFTISAGRMRAPQTGGDIARELTDELVTLHHSLTAEIHQHEEARFPFIGARDTSLATAVLRKFDADLERLRLYAQTGYVAEPELFPVDFETVRFVPRPTNPPPDA